VGRKEHTDTDQERAQECESEKRYLSKSLLQGLGFRVYLPKSLLQVRSALVHSGFHQQLFLPFMRIERFEF